MREDLSHSGLLVIEHCLAGVYRGLSDDLTLGGDHARCWGRPRKVLGEMSTFRMSYLFDLFECSLAVEPVEGFAENIKHNLYMSLFEVHQPPRDEVQSSLDFALLGAVRINGFGV